MVVSYSRDADGRELAHVPLKNSTHQVRLFRKDHDAVVAKFGPVAWYVNSNGRGRLYVRLTDRARGNNEMVARHVIGAPPRRHVKLRNRDPFDLTKPNLELVVARGGKRRTSCSKPGPA